MNKHLFLSLLLLAPAAAIADEPAASKPMKIGYVRAEKLMDIQAVEALDEIKDLDKELTTELEGRVAKWQSENQKLEKDAADLRSEKAKWSSPESREAKFEELAKRSDKLGSDKRYIENFQNRQQQKIQMEMYNKIKKSVEQFGEKEGFDLVLVAAAFYVGKRVDVTVEVRTMLNKEYETTKKKTTTSEADSTSKA